MLDTYLQEVTFLERKEIKIDKSGKRKVQHKKLMPGLESSTPQKRRSWPTAARVPQIGSTPPATLLR